MDNFAISAIVAQIQILKYSFNGVWSADNFPVLSSCTKPLFQIINTSPSNSAGAHWLLLISIPSVVVVASPTKLSAKKKICVQNIIIFNSLFIPICYFDHFNKRIRRLYKNKSKYKIHEITPQPSIQSLSSNLCGLYCILAATLLITKTNCCSVSPNTAKNNDSAVVALFRLNCYKILQPLSLMSEVTIVRYFNNIIGCGFKMIII